MIDFENAFQEITVELSGQQKRIPVNSSLSVYYGISKDGYLRLAFLSKGIAPRMESTKILRVEQGEERRGVFWTCFDLLKNDVKKVFFAFCSNIIESVTDVFDENNALNALRKRYIAWKAMFKRESGTKIPREVIQGLFGELYFMKKYMFDKYGALSSVNAWSGPDSKSKDYAVNSEWYEIKTVGANATEAKISSLAQLSSDYIGHLAIIRVEAMSNGFNGEDSCIIDLVRYIIEHIDSESGENEFMEKFASYGFDPSDDGLTCRFNVKSMERYRVDSNFPRLTEKDVQWEEICDVGYSLLINSLNQYKEE